MLSSNYNCSISLLPAGCGVEESHHLTELTDVSTLKSEILKCIFSLLNSVHWLDLSNPLTSTLGLTKTASGFQLEIVEKYFHFNISLTFLSLQMSKCKCSGSLMLSECTKI